MKADESQSSWRQRAKSLLGRRGTVLVRCVTRGLPIPRWGNLRRAQPFSTNFGFERGTPVDRHYLHGFLQEHAASITGRVLEIQVTGYTDKFGRNVAERHTVDINDAFAPTYCCDLANATQIPDDYYDCFLLPNTLCVLRDIEGCLAQALRVVRPGGVVLATTAAMVPLTRDTPDYWHMSAAGWHEVASRVWPEGSFVVRGYGNSVAAVAAILGLAAEELTLAELDAFDERVPVLVSLACRKPQ